MARSQCKGKQERDSTMCVSVPQITLNTPASSAVPPGLQSGPSGSHSVSYMSCQPLPGAKGQPGHQSLSGSLLKSLNRSCGGPGLSEDGGRCACRDLVLLRLEVWSRGVREASRLSGLVQPLRLLGGLAGVHVHSVGALLAPHSTAPMELALTLRDAGDSRRVIASAAAHDFTAICPF